MEAQPPVSPQQSECNPVGALQVGCILIPHACLPSLVPGAVGEADGGRVPCSEGFPHPPPFTLPLTWNLRLRDGSGGGCEDSSLTHSCTPLFLPSKELVVQKGWRLPEYTVTQESGPAHRKEFTMTCRVERFIEIGNWAEGSACSDYPAALQPWPGAAPSFSLRSWLRPWLGCCFLAPFLALLFWPAGFSGAWQILSPPFQLTATEGTLSPSLSWVEAMGLLGTIIQQPSPLCRQWHVQKAGKA